jgi:hypothetical protein
MKGVETSISLIQCLLHSALLTRYTAVVEKLPRMQGAALFCSVVSIESVVVDVFQITAVVRWEGMSPGDIEQ